MRARTPGRKVPFCPWQYLAGVRAYRGVAGSAAGVAELAVMAGSPAHDELARRLVTRQNATRVVAAAIVGCSQPFWSPTGLRCSSPGVGTAC